MAPQNFFPTALAPHLCTLSNEVPGDDSWLHELKYDGWRLMCRKDGKDVRFFTRSGVEWSRRLPTLTCAIQSLSVRRAWFDGELVHLDRDGYPGFHALHQDIHTRQQSRLFYQLWDVPWHNSRSVATVPLIERKQLLQKLLVHAPPNVRYTDHVTENGREFFDLVDAMNLEGIVSKRPDSSYPAGRRTRNWLKVKAWRSYSVVVGALEHDANGHLEALLVGTPDGQQLCYDGRVEFGLGRLGEVRSYIESLATNEQPFGGRWSARRRTWLRPEMRITIKALPKRDGYMLRHATFLHLEPG